MKNLSKLLISILMCEGVGLISVPFTIASIPTWYASLNKPSFSPPNFIFSPVWTFLYFLMGVSFYLIWRKGLKSKKVKTALFYFLIQLFFNFLWSILFFGFHAPLLAFWDIIVLWIFIFITIMRFAKISQIASYLLTPYFLWVSFASILNFSIVILN